MVCTKSMFVIVQYRFLGSFCILAALAAQRYCLFKDALYVYIVRLFMYRQVNKLSWLQCTLLTSSTRGDFSSITFWPTKNLKKVYLYKVRKSVSQLSENMSTSLSGSWQKSCLLYCKGQTFNKIKICPQALKKSFYTIYQL